MSHVIVDTFMASHHGQIPEEVWERRRQNWTYEVSAQAWERTLRGIADGTTPEECVYLAETEAGEIVGLAMGQGKEADTSGATGEICVLYVRPDHQGQGAGRRLVAAVAARLAQWGMTTLHIEVLKANVPACRFYEALGGEVVAECDREEEGFALPLVIYGWAEIGTLTVSAHAERRATAS